MLYIVQDKTVERRRYGVVAGAVELLIDPEGLLQVVLGLLGLAGLAQQNGVVLQRKRGIGMLAAERLLKDRDCPQIERTRFVELSL